MGKRVGQFLYDLHPRQELISCLMSLLPPPRAVGAAIRVSVFTFLLLRYKLEGAM